MEAAVIECQQYGDQTEAFYLVHALQHLVTDIHRSMTLRDTLSRVLSPLLWLACCLLRALSQQALQAQSPTRPRTACNSATLLSRLWEHP